MLDETSIVDQITILQDGQLQVRRADIVQRDGLEIAREYHRHVISPGQDISGEDERVRRVASVIHTKAVNDAYQKAAFARVDLP